MKITLEKLINSASSNETEKSPLNKLLDTKLPVKTSYRISRVISKIEPEIKLFNQTRLELIKKHGKEDKETGQYNIPKKSIEKFTKEINELLTQEIEIDFDCVKIEELGDITIEPSILVSLDWLITE